MSDPGRPSAAGPGGSPAPAKKAQLAYHTPQTLTADLARLRGLDKQGLVAPNVKTIDPIPTARMPIPAIRIGKNPGHRILFLGGSHAREWISVEVPYLLAELLVKVANGIKVDPYYDRYHAELRWLVEHREIWIVPLLNPEGHAFSRQQGHESWRKNRRRLKDETYTTERGDTWEKVYQRFGPAAGSAQKVGGKLQLVGIDDKGVRDWQELAKLNPGVKVSGPKAPLPAGTRLTIPVYGVDLNRNFPHQWGRRWDRNKQRLQPFGGSPGPRAASEYEVQAIIGLVRRASREGKPFQGAMSFHSYGGMVLYPWGHRPYPPRQPAIAELAGYLVERINEVRKAHLPPNFQDLLRQTEKAEREGSGMNQLNFVAGLADRSFYFPLYPGVVDFGQEGGSFLDWFYAQGRGAPAYTVELSQAKRPAGVFQVGPQDILPTFRENLPAALAFAASATLARRSRSFPRPQNATRLTAKPKRSSTVYVCYFFPWGSSKDYSLGWKKNGRGIAKVAWGDEVDLTLEARAPAPKDLALKFEVYESDLLRSTDDPLIHLETRLQKGAREAAVRWRVGQTAKGRDAESAYRDTGRPEFQFRLPIGGDVLRSHEVELLQDVRLLWEVPAPFRGTFTLIGRFRGMPSDLSFSGSFVVSRAYGPTYKDTKDVAELGFDSAKQRPGLRVRRLAHAIEVRQTIGLKDLFAGEPAKLRQEFPIAGNGKLRLNRTREPRFALRVQMKVGGASFRAEEKDLLIRPFEGLFIHHSGRPSLARHPSEDEPPEAAYRQRMVKIPDEVVVELKKEVTTANAPQTDFRWWPRQRLPRPGFFLRQATVSRTVKTRQQVRRQLAAFVALAAADREVRELIDRGFKLDKVNDALFVSGPARIRLSSTQTSTGVVVLKVSGRRGTSATNAVTEVVTLRGTNKVQSRHTYQSLQSLELRSGQLAGLIKVETPPPRASPGAPNPVYDVNVTEDKIRYDNLRSFNAFLAGGGAPLSLASTEAADRGEITVLGHSDAELRTQVAEKIAIGAQGTTRFFKVNAIYLDRDFRGVLSFRATRGGATRTLWRNLFDEDIPEKYVRSFRGRSLNIVVGRRIEFLQKLATAFARHLGIDKEIRVFLYDSGRTTARVAVTYQAPEYHLVEGSVSHGHFYDPNVAIPTFIHELKHAHQNDRVAKLGAGTDDAAGLEKSDDGFDSKIVRAWRLNKGSGYVSSTQDQQRYSRQIVEVDSEELKKRVAKGLFDL